jgi:hypothetical protein
MTPGSSHDRSRRVLRGLAAIAVVACACNGKSSTSLTRQLGATAGAGNQSGSGSPPGGGAIGQETGGSSARVGVAGGTDQPGAGGGFGTKGGGAGNEPESLAGAAGVELGNSGGGGSSGTTVAAGGKHGGAGTSAAGSGASAGSSGGGTSGTGGGTSGTGGAAVTEQTVQQCKACVTADATQRCACDEACIRCSLSPTPQCTSTMDPFTLRTQCQCIRSLCASDCPGSCSEPRGSDSLGSRAETPGKSREAGPIKCSPGGSRSLRARALGSRIQEPCPRGHPRARRTRVFSVLGEQVMGGVCPKNRRKLR